MQIGFDDAALTAFLTAFPSVLLTGPRNFTARIDLAAGTGAYQWNGTLINITLSISQMENIDGSAFFETLSGNAEANVINGEGGNDTLQGRGGADTLNGGSGRDRAVYDNSAAVSIDLTSTSTQSGGEAEGDRLISIEDIDGSRFSDTIRGNSAANELFGNLGNDLLEGRGGGDILDGGGGIDTATYEASTSRVVVRLDDPNTGRNSSASGGHAEGDRLISIENLIGSMWDDTLTGNGGINVLRGGGSADVLNGLGDDDILDGGSGSDILDGGEGTDTATYAGATAAVQVTLRDGADGTVRETLSVRDTLRSIETVVGSNFGDSFFGNGSDNRFDGGDGNDSFFSSRGNDTYNGGAGIDTMDFGSDEQRHPAGRHGEFPGSRRDSCGPARARHVHLDREDGRHAISGRVHKSISGSEIMFGSLGSDTYFVNDREDEVREFANAGFDRVLSSVDYALLAGQHIELLATDNAAGTLAIDLTGNELDNTLQGNAGRNILSGGGGADIVAP